MTRGEAAMCKEIARELRQQLPEQVNLADLMGAEAFMGSMWGWDDPAPYAMDRAACWLEALADSSPTPDPDTGLVPCGCGGKAKYINSYYDDVWMYENYVGCPDCYASSAHISTSKHGYSKEIETEIKLMLKDKWNTAHGYTEPPLPGAIGPDVGETAPNGAANA